MLFMEEKIIQLGLQKKFEGILTTNTHKLTQKISAELGYDILSSIQVTFDLIIQYHIGFTIYKLSFSPYLTLVENSNFDL